MQVKSPAFARETLAKRETLKLFNKPFYYMSSHKDKSNLKENATSSKAKGSYYDYGLKK